MIDELLQQMIAACQCTILEKRRPKKSGAYVCLFTTVTDMLRCTTLKMQYRDDFCVDEQQTYDIKTQYIVYVGLLLSPLTQHAIFKQVVLPIKTLSVNIKKHYEVVVVTQHQVLNCHFCFATATANGSVTLSKCSQCNDTRYCCSDCQKQDWVRHRLECVAVLKAKTEVENQFDPSVMNVSVPINF